MRTKIQPQSNQNFGVNFTAPLGSTPLGLGDSEEVFRPEYPEFLYPVYRAIFDRYKIMSKEEDMATPGYDPKFPRTVLRYVASANGRGVGRTTSINLMMIELAMRRRSNIAFFRETDNANEESSFGLLCEMLWQYGLLDTHFRITRKPNVITEINTGSRMTFGGMQSHNVNRKKGRALVDVAVLDEATDYTDRVFELFLPTMRGGLWHPLTLVILIWNPELDDDPVQERFINNPPPPRTLFAHGRLEDNPFASQSNKEDRALDRENDPQLAKHIWDGETRRQSELAVFNNFRYGDLDETIRKLKIPPRLGCDFGFSRDPTHAVEVYRIPHLNILYWAYEACDWHTELHLVPHLVAGKHKTSKHKWQYSIKDYKGLPSCGFSETLWCDSAEPGRVSLMQGTGLNCKGRKKYAGLVADGVEFIRMHTNVISRRCPNVYNDFLKRKYKEDTHTGKAKSDLEKGWDHSHDACVYAYLDVIKAMKEEKVGSYRHISVR